MWHGSYVVLDKELCQHRLEHDMRKEPARAGMLAIGEREIGVRGDREVGVDLVPSLRLKFERVGVDVRIVVYILASNKHGAVPWSHHSI